MFQLTFKINNLLTERWLTYMATLGCTGEVGGLGYSDEVTKLLQFHRLKLWLQ